jgi:hypothetical protein
VTGFHAILNPMIALGLWRIAQVLPAARLGRRARDHRHRAVPLCEVRRHPQPPLPGTHYSISFISYLYYGQFDVCKAFRAMGYSGCL